MMSAAWLSPWMCDCPHELDPTSPAVALPEEPVGSVLQHDRSPDVVVRSMSGMIDWSSTVVSEPTMSATLDRSC
eukprot:608247-Pyramimonas_sp.AAC.1